MFNSNLVFVIASRGNKVARTSYRPGQKGHSEYVAETTYTISEAAAISMTSFTIGQLLQTGFKGRVSIVLPDNAAIRAFEAASAIKNGEDIESRLIKSWMNEAGQEEWLEATQEFAQAMNATTEVEGLSLNFVKNTNLTRWNLSSNDGLDLSEVLAEVKTIKLVDGLCEELGVSVDNNRVAGEFEVKSEEFVDRAGEQRTNYFVDRVNNSARIANVRKIATIAWNLVPAEELLADDDEVIAADGSF